MACFRRNEMWAQMRLVLTVYAATVKYLRAGTRVASPTRLYASYPPVSQICTIWGSKSKHARRKHSHPQYRFVWGVGKVGIPDLLELWAKLSQFRWLWTPFDSCVDRAERYDRQLKGDERRKGRRTRMLSGPSRYLQTRQ
jgi:hypothetical protein